MDEFSVIERFFTRPPTRNDVCVGVGDDAAVVNAPAGHQLVVTTDVLVAGVHFLESVDAHSVGYKSLAVNLSDLAAMGATPAWAVLGLVVPSVNVLWLERFSSGFFSLAERFDVDLVGGDTTRGPLTVAVQLGGWVPHGTALRRKGARKDDYVYVSGTLGDAALAMRNRDGALDLSTAEAAAAARRLDYPEPRVELGARLRPFASAAIDISDGLVADLGHLLRNSKVGAKILLEQLPLADAYKSRVGEIGWEPALSTGDDYELCFTAAPEHEFEIKALADELEVNVARIGAVIDGDEIIFLDPKGQRYEPRAHGYNHFAEE